MLSCYVKKLVVFLTVFILIFSLGCSNKGKKPVSNATQKVKVTETAKEEKKETKKTENKENKEKKSISSSEILDLEALAKQNDPLADPLAIENLKKNNALPTIKPNEVKPNSNKKVIKDIQSKTPTAEELFDIVQTLYASVDSAIVKGNSRVVAYVDGNKADEMKTESSTIIFKRPNKLVIDSPNEKMVSDGKKFYQYNKKAKVYDSTNFKDEMLESLVNSRLGVGTLGLLLRTDYKPALTNFKMLKDDKVNNKDTYVIEFSMKNDKKNSGDLGLVQKLWIGKSDGVVYKNEAVLTAKAKDDKNKTHTMKTVITGNVSSFEANPTIKAGTFSFTPPKNVKKYEEPKIIRLEDKPAPDFSFEWTDGST
ncbi:MAG: DUF2092 domain-containing protein, partial [Armatimonadota bacterium]